jgi:hypothetical protein
MLLKLDIRREYGVGMQQFCVRVIAPPHSQQARAGCGFQSREFRTHRLGQGQ